MATVGVTLLDVVNKINIRLRDTIVTSITSTVSSSPATTTGMTNYTDTLVRLINDAKREVEDSFNWLDLQETITLPLVEGTTTYALQQTSGGEIYTNSRTRVIDVYNTTDNVRISPRPYNYVRQLAQNTTVVNAAPSYYSLKGLITPTYSSSGTNQINQSLEFYIYPTPDAAYNLSVECVIPQEDLFSNTDYFKAPWNPIYLKALSLAIRERGEDEGEMSSDVERAYQKALGDAIAYEQEHLWQSQGGGDWYVGGDY